MIYYYSEILSMAVKAYFYRNDSGLQFEAIEAENDHCSILYSKDLEHEATKQLEKQTEEQRAEYLLATRTF